ICVSLHKKSLGILVAPSQVLYLSFKILIKLLLPQNGVFCPLFAFLVARTPKTLDSFIPFVKYRILEF
ncbi:MAG: hypothetical protein AAGI49_10380, partial [Bacteroidota bacterium]